MDGKSSHSAMRQREPIDAADRNQLSTLDIPSGEHEDIHFEDDSAGLRFDNEALAALDWQKIKEYLSGFCKTAMGQQRALRIPFLPTKTEIERELAQTQEALTLSRQRGESLPLSHIPDLTLPCQRLAKGGRLEADILLQFRHMLTSAEQIKRFIGQIKEELPALWERAELLDPLPNLRKEIERAIDESGQLRDDASWELGALRREVRSCHERIKRKLQHYLTGPQSRHLNDNYYTLREDRYVLPVKASDRNKIPGIVYGSSKTGQTIYIEPQPLVDLNNALRMAENDVAQEEARILQKLSQLTTKSLPHLRSNLDLLRDLDLIYARVRFAEELNANIPVLVEPSEGGFNLKRARHPLLIIKGVKVVANDIHLDHKRRGLLISGPNTGGKTVTLKTIGLFSLMVRAALPIPADEGSQVPLLTSVYSDIGDRQSIEQDLSTFSAQILKLRSILEKADEETLVLVDEIVVGTDPVQGSCLAAAILQELAECNAYLAVTTHYESLKSLPYEDERFENASVGFDLQKLEPTYRLYIGTPGCSNALQIARRLGLSDRLCHRVEKLLDTGTDRFERIVSRLEQQYEELYEERDRATRARQRVEKQMLTLQRKEDEITELRERLLRGEVESLQRELREAKEEIRSTVKTLQKKKQGGDLSKAHEVEREIQRLQKQAKETVQELDKKHKKASPKAQQVQVGAKVRVHSLKAEGEVLEAPNEQGQVHVRVGNLRIRIPLSDIQLKGQGGGAHKQPRKTKSKQHLRAVEPRKKRQEEPEAQDEGDDFLAIQTRENRCDMRGLNVEEALQNADSFLDQAYHREWNTVFLIHGNGTGALRKAIRQLCKESPYIERYRPGGRGEGGEGVTVVKLSTT